MRLLNLILLFLALTFTGKINFSQTPEPLPKPVSSRTETKTKCFSEKPFDSGTNTLPPNYHGNDLKELIGEITRRENLSKDEFETTKQFLERVENEKKKNFLGDLNSDSVFSFEIGERNFKYDADNELMNFEISSSFVSWSTPCQDNERNALFDNNYQLLFVTGKSSLPLNLNFKINIEKAKNSKPNLRVLSIGKIKDNSDKSYIVRSNSTFRSSEYALTFLLKELWIYDVTTGEIFLKHKPDFEKLREETNKVIITDENLRENVGSLQEYAIQRVNPIYPQVAKSIRLTGVVRVDIVVDKDGNVEEVTNTSGPGLLMRAALDAVRKWKFKPFHKDGKAIKVTGFVSFIFSL